ncbi:MAG: hypothetical protein CMH52_10605 [Myxococcales bacterium]|nr:hypothetical protein [Myxococcales bacterium]
MGKHPDHSANLNRVKRIRGQIDGIERMILDNRYCPDILNQTKAVGSAIRSLESSLLKRHLEHCVANAFEQSDEVERGKKINELLEIFSRRLDK